MVQPKKPTSSRESISFSQADEQLRTILFTRTPIWLRVWLVLLMGTNMLGIVFLITIEGQMTLALIPFVGPPMTYLYKKYGYVKLLGLAHIIPWSGLVYWIVSYRLALADEDSFHYKWMKTLATFNTISLILDVKDVFEYVVLGKTNPIYEY